MDKIAKALHQYWNSFDVPAYPENDIPDNAKLPYIVYRVQQGETFEQMPDYIQIFTKGKNSKKSIQIADAIKQDIGLCRRIELDVGHILIYQIRFQIRKDTEENSLANYGDFAIEYNTK